MEEKTAPKNEVEAIIDAPKSTGDEKVECIHPITTYYCNRFIDFEQDGFSRDSCSSRGAERERDQIVGLFFISKKSKDLLRPLSKPLSVKDSRQGTTSIVNIALPSEKMLAWTKSHPGIESVLTRKKRRRED